MRSLRLLSMEQIEIGEAEAHACRGNLMARCASAPSMLGQAERADVCSRTGTRIAVKRAAPPRVEQGEVSYHSE